MTIRAEQQNNEQRRIVKTAKEAGQQKQLLWREKNSDNKDYSSYTVLEKGEGGRDDDSWRSSGRQAETEWGRRVAEASSSLP